MNLRPTSWTWLRQKITTKIFLVFGSLLALNLASLAAVSIGIKIIDDRLESIVNTHAPLRAAAFELEINTVGTGMGVMKYLEKPDPKHRERVTGDAADFRRFKGEYERLISSDAGRRLGEEIGDRYGSFIALGKDLMNRHDRLESLLADIGNGIHRTNEVLERQIEGGNANSDLSRVEIRLHEVGQGLAFYLLTRDGKYLGLIERGARDLRRLLAGWAGGPAWQKDVHRLTEQALQQVDSIILMQQSRDQDVQRFIEMRRNLDDLLDDGLQKLVEQDSLAAKREAVATAHRVMALMAVLIVLLLVANWIAIRVLARTVTRPLRDLADGVVAVSTGDLDHRIKLKADDEFGEVARSFNRMAETLRTSYASLEDKVDERTMALRESEARLRANLENTPNVAVQWFDEAGRVIYWNPASELLYGWPAQEALGKTLDQLILTPGQAAEFLRLLGEVQASGKPSRPYEALSHTRDRQERWTLSTVFALPMGEGQLCFACMSVDITARIRAEAELKAHRQHLQRMVEERTRDLASAKEAAESANIAKSAFLANMSHEIRTPLNAISGMAHLVRRQGLTPKQDEQMDKLDKASRHLADLINAILDLSKIEAGKFELADSEVRLEEIAANVQSILQEGVRAKGLEWVPDLPDHPPRLRGDSPRLQQALLNFAANAVKFTEHGRITLRIRVEEESDKDARVRFEVEDTGMGIETEVLSRLFTPFEQADNSTTRKYGGTGLGLVITKKVAQLMGGEAGATSKPGNGSTFWFTARLGKAMEEPVPTSTETGTTEADAILRRDHAGRRILLVEDEPVNQEVAKFLLEDVGLQVDIATDGVEAKAKAADYDLILMDMQMPRMNGLEATRAIRALPQHARTPILAMTANAFAEDKGRCLEAGMDDFLTKPVVPGVLFATLLKWLESGKEPHSD